MTLCALFGVWKDVDLLEFCFYDMIAVIYFTPTYLTYSTCEQSYPLQN